MEFIYKIILFQSQTALLKLIARQRFCQRHTQIILSLVFLLLKIKHFWTSFLLFYGASIVMHSPGTWDACLWQNQQLNDNLLWEFVPFWWVQEVIPDDNRPPSGNRFPDEQAVLSSIQSRRRRRLLLFFQFVACASSEMHQYFVVRLIFFSFLLLLAIFYTFFSLFTFHIILYSRNGAVVFYVYMVFMYICSVCVCFSGNLFWSKNALTVTRVSLDFLYNKKKIV